MDDDELISPDNPDDDSAEDELRYAPRDAADAPETVESSADEAQVEESIFEDAPAEDLMPMAPEVELDAALAAVSTLDDMLAEQEAAEQAEIARQQAEIEAEAQREARLKNPEFFFPHAAPAGHTARAYGFGDSGPGANCPGYLADLYADQRG